MKQLAGILVVFLVLAVATASRSTEALSTAPSCAAGTTPYYGGPGKYSIAVNAPAGTIIDAAYLATANGCFGPYRNTGAVTPDSCYLVYAGLQQTRFEIWNKTTREPTGICPPIDRVDVRLVAHTPVPQVPRGPQGAATLTPPTPGLGQRVAAPLLPTQSIPVCCAPQSASSRSPQAQTGSGLITPPRTGDGALR